MIRRHDFSRLENEIREEGIQKSAAKTRMGFGLVVPDRKSEVDSNRNKNLLSGISTLPGSFAAQTRINSTLKREASQRNISNIEHNFGGAAKPIVDRPLMQRNKSFVELGNKNARFGADHYRKENDNSFNTMKSALN